jgi:hypothetical protein
MKGIAPAKKVVRQEQKHGSRGRVLFFRAVPLANGSAIEKEACAQPEKQRNDGKDYPGTAQLPIGERSLCALRGGQCQFALGFFHATGFDSSQSPGQFGRGRDAQAWIDIGSVGNILPQQGVGKWSTPAPDR